MAARGRERHWGAVRHAPDYGLLAVAAVLLVIGLIAVYSSSYALGYAQFGDPNFFIKRQTMAALVGVTGLVLAMQIDYHRLRRLSPLLMLGALLLLSAVLLPGIGVEQNGARRWIALGPLPPLQPSEFAKLAVIVYMAAWLAAKGQMVRDVALGVLPFVGMVGLVAALIVLEPDLGTALLVAAITALLFFVAGARLSHLLTLGATAAVATGVLVLVEGYRVDRLVAFARPQSDPSGIGFQTLQMLVALGSGGISGLGLGVSRQKFFYVPASHTDGVIAIIGEELGLIGVLVVLSLFALLLWRGVQIARRAPDAFGSLLAIGVVAWITIQLLVNVGGVTRSLPLTGVPLPLLSYGGSSLVMLLTAIGLLLSVSRYAAIGESAPARPLPRPTRTAAAGGSTR
ncbi:MAG: putative lipid II flippase FtsW [Dehalococcoidia bacterium]|nr:putative lipid II flippase FtsW [Dehalococcoidia bacterium]